MSDHTPTADGDRAAAPNPIHGLAGLWHQRSAREKWLLALAVAGTLLAVGYVTSQRLLPPLLAHLAPPAERSPLLARLPPVIPVEADAWRRAALSHGLVLTRVQVQPERVITHGEADSPEAFTAFARWAAQQGWWALAWTLERDGEANLTLEAHWSSQPETAFPSGEAR